MLLNSGSDGHPYHPDGSRYRNWRYEKDGKPAPVIVWPKEGWVPMAEPAPREVEDYILTDADKEALARAEAKRARKLQKQQT